GSWESYGPGGVPLATLATVPDRVKHYSSATVPPSPVPNRLWSVADAHAFHASPSRVRRTQRCSPSQRARIRSPHGADDFSSRTQEHAFPWSVAPVARPCTTPETACRTAGHRSPALLPCWRQTRYWPSAESPSIGSCVGSCRFFERPPDRLMADSRND